MVGRCRHALTGARAIWCSIFDVDATCDDARFRSQLAMAIDNARLYRKEYDDAVSKKLLIKAFC